MHKEDRSTIEQGMQLVARLPDIMSQQADERIKPIYEDIQQVLRVPIVNLIFRTLANYPDYLEAAWRELRPLANSREFEQAADDLRARALLPQSSEPSDMRTKQPADMEKLRAFNDTIHYVLPKLLLIVTALAKSLAEQGATISSSNLKRDFSAMSACIAEGTEKVEMVDPEKADERVHALFEEIKNKHAHTLVSSYYRGLANWPDMLEAIWKTIAPYVGEGEYEGKRQSLIDYARLHVDNWPPISMKIEVDALADIEAILAAFQLKFIPEMLIDAVLIKSFIDGSNPAATSRFSLTH